MFGKVLVGIMLCDSLIFDKPQCLSNFWHVIFGTPSTVQCAWRQWWKAKLTWRSYFGHCTFWKQCTGSSRWSARNNFRWKQGRMQRQNRSGTASCQITHNQFCLGMVSQCWWNVLFRVRRSMTCETNFLVFKLPDGCHASVSLQPDNQPVSRNSEAPSTSKRGFWPFRTEIVRE